ncbi:ATP-dependent Clp protease proteolytic subunit [Phocaeicola sp. Sa1CVN1]|uniref:ATP-dependent Clp protease proteolytic subunit n=1 Tax=Phocaeicola intestinalis TaxID=2762212 RepID=A0ABR8YAS9_9BACT|nr:Clp protease ClpP [Phocaeicola intestinalis]MBD8041332.1 ATP-dependent Clp protease proteolytic subunit [Phocaeicola intestinalis]
MEYNLSIDSHIGPWGYSKNYIRSQMSGFKNKPVNVRISSLGGSVDDALDIRQQFLDHGNVTCYLFGYVASAATILATGAKKTCMSKYAFYLIHKVSNRVDAWGNYNADQIQQLIDDLKANKLENDKMDLVLANLYANKCKKKVDDILPILKEGRWLTAQEALEYGFIDEIVEEGSKLNFDDSMKTKFNMFHLPALPAIDRTQSQEADTAPSWFNNFVNKFLKGHQPEAAQTQNKSLNQSKQMKKDYQKVNSILKIEGVEVDKDGKVMLTEDQVKALNDHIAHLEQESSDKDNQISDLKKQNENLQKNDGEETTHINGDEGEDDDIAKLNTAKELFNDVKDLL